jgi:hypothetical protein
MLGASTQRGVFPSTRLVLRDRTLTINDLDALKDAALFSPSYLQLYRHAVD